MMPLQYTVTVTRPQAVTATGRRPALVRKHGMVLHFDTWVDASMAARLLEQSEHDALLYLGIGLRAFTYCVSMRRSRAGVDERSQRQ